MYAVSALFELLLNFFLTFSKLKPAYGRAPDPDYSDDNKKNTFNNDGNKGHALKSYV